MVTDEKMINTALTRYRLGNILIWLGVIVWLPFIVLRITGEKPSLFCYLPFHLISVLGGSRLRSFARKEMGMMPPRKNMLSLAGHTMIFLGILVWAPHLYLTLVMGQSVDVMNYLPYHLTGVLGGTLLHVLSYVIERYAKR